MSTATGRLVRDEVFWCPDDDKWTLHDFTFNRECFHKHCKSCGETETFYIPVKGDLDPLGNLAKMLETVADIANSYGETGVSKLRLIREIRVIYKLSFEEASTLFDLAIEENYIMVGTRITYTDKYYSLFSAVSN